MKYVLSIISMLVLASCGGDATNKHENARETKYLYRIYFVDYRGEKEYDNPYHENKECISIKAAQRKRPDLAIERFGVDDINELCFCPCVSDKTYKMILEKVKLKESNIFYDNRKKLYDALSDDYDMGSFKKFCADIKDAVKRRKLYDAISSSYSDIGSFEEFSSKLGYGSNEAASGDSVAAAEPQPTDNTFTAGVNHKENLYKVLTERFDNLGSFEEFNSKLGYDKAKTAD